MRKTVTHKWLESINACSEAVEAWEKEKVKSPIECLEILIKRKQYNWANWLICRVMDVKQRRKYAEFAAEKAIRLVLKTYHEPSYILWAGKWLSKEDRSAEAARAAEAAGAAGAAAEAAAGAARAARAAGAAAGAARAAAEAAAGAAEAAAGAAGAAMQLKILRYGMKMLKEIKENIKKLGGEV